MNKLNYILFSLLSFFFVFSASAQKVATGGVTRSEDPTDFMRSNGKVYVVVAVIVIILSGLFIYLYNLDKKISAIEKRNTTH